MEENPQQSEAETSPLTGATSAYKSLRLSVRELSERLAAEYRDHLKCGAGCSACCQHNLSVFPVEAFTVSKAFLELSEELKAIVTAQAASAKEEQDIPCPFLVEDKCSIYESRPLICMTQGLPLMYEAEDGKYEVDFCPLNFGTEEGIDSLNDEGLVPLDSLNLKLAIANSQFCQEAGYDKAGERRKMSSIILEAK